MLEEKLDELRVLKREATASRNLGEFDEGLTILKKVIKGLTALQMEGGVEPGLAATIRAELADTLGMKGGLCRRKNNPKKALQAYEEGREIEKIDGKSTYNLTNTITLGITVRKTSPEDRDMKADLEAAITELERETKGARDDEWWAWSDLGQFYLLLDKPDEAERCYTRARLTGPTKGEYKRHIAILKELADATEKSAPSISKNIKTVITELSQYT